MVKADITGAIEMQI